jgi:hypothetical protein
MDILPVLKELNEPGHNVRLVKVLLVPNMASDVTE